MNTKLRSVARKVSIWSLKKATEEQNLDFCNHPINDQYTYTQIESNSLLEYKLKALHAWQIKFTVKFINDYFNLKNLCLYDIGDSSGNHIQMLKKVLHPLRELDTTSFNCDEKAVDRINNKGLRAIHTRNVDIGDWVNKGWLCKPNIVISYQTLEHMTNLIGFIRSLHKITSTFLFTVPYVRKSRIGFHHMKNKNCGITSEDLHVFELSSKDYDTIFRHYGWRLFRKSYYRQYPSYLFFPFRWLWKKYDFEGFYGAIYIKE